MTMQELLEMELQARTAIIVELFRKLHQLEMRLQRLELHSPRSTGEVENAEEIGEELEEPTTESDTRERRYKERKQRPDKSRKVLSDKRAPSILSSKSGETSEVEHASLARRRGATYRTGKSSRY